eukprot:2051211-Prorocentrum_lima.AAC.1
MPALGRPWGHRTTPLAQASPLARGPAKWSRESPHKSRLPPSTVGHQRAAQGSSHRRPHPPRHWQL